MSRFCDCSKYCGNPPKSVSLATYYRHTKYRQQQAFSSTFTSFLANFPTQEGSTSRKRALENQSKNLPKRTRKGKEKAAYLEDDSAHPQQPRSPSPSSGTGLPDVLYDQVGSESGPSDRPLSPCDGAGIASGSGVPASSDTGASTGEEGVSDRPDPGSLADQQGMCRILYLVYV
jgi:hypothetical protein